MSQGRADWVVARRSWRAAAPTAVAWGLALGTVVAASAFGYAEAYPTLASRERIAASIAANPGFAALFGPARDLTAVNGFVVWRTLVLATLIGGVWGLFVGTRALRGEEDAGRWELLLSGPTTPRRAAAAAIGGTVAAVATFWATTAAVVVAIGRSHTGAASVGAGLYFAVAATLGALIFAAVGAVVGELVPVRRRALALGGGVLGVAFALKVIADTTAVRWLSWATPFGWVERLRPFEGSDLWPIVPAGVLLAVAIGGAVALAHHRDLGAGYLLRDRPPRRAAVLRSVGALDRHLARGGLVAWTAGLFVLAALFGAIAKSAAQAIEGSARANSVLRALIHGHNLAAAYLGFMFVIVATVAGLLAVSQVAALREEEGDGRGELVLSRPVTRPQWLRARALTFVGVVAVAALAAGLGAWAGAAPTRAGISVLDALGASVNVGAAAGAVFGLTVAVYGWWPRAAVVAGYAVVAGSLLLLLVGSLLHLSHWVLDLSVLDHLSAAPAVEPAWTAVVALVAVGLGGTAVGVSSLARRDLAAA